MAGNQEEVLAVRQQFTDWLSKKQWSFREEDAPSAYVFRFELHGEDIPINLVVVFEKDRAQFSVLSSLPGTIPEEKRGEAYALLNLINDASDFGKITMNTENGSLRFRYCAYYDQCLLSDAFFKHVIYNCATFIDDFNDRLLMFSKGMVSAEDSMRGLLY